MKEEIALIQQASGVSDIRYWSGGNLYTNIYDAAECAGLNVNSDWKNPKTQSTDLALVGVNPWRPSGGTNGTDFSLFAQHDPNGAVVFLPEGQYDETNFASMRRSDDAGGDEAYFEYLEQSLLASLAAAEPGKVNVFHFTDRFRRDGALRKRQARAWKTSRTFRGRRQLSRMTSKRMQRTKAATLCSALTRALHLTAHPAN